MPSSIESVRRPDWEHATGHGLSRVQQELIFPSTGENDLDIFRDRLNAAYYPAIVDTTSRDHALDGGRLSVRVLDRMTVGFARFGRDVLVDPGVIDGYHVNVPLAGTVRSRHGAQEAVVRPGMAAIFGPSAPTRLPLWSANAAQLCIKIERGLIEEELGALLGRSVRVPLTFRIGLPLSSGPGREWSRLLWTLVDAIDSGDLPRAVLSHLERALIARLLYSASHDQREALDAPGAPVLLPRTLRTLLTFVEESADGLLTTADLARHAGVSARRVEQTFREHLGVTPSAYLAGVRLDRARRALSDPAPGESVTAVMYRHGFSNHSRFATLYRQRFGEYPSATLRRASR